ncbi:MAG: hypothetical protein K1X94_02350 [Sandaracinaceae bacterium]|nr:hypothetical protein [Sandaracinaceae bacterium]
MHRRFSPLSLAALLAIAVAWQASEAHAQITYTYQTYGDRGTPSSGATNYLVSWPLSFAECEANEPIRMVITNAPYDATGVTRLEWDLWQGGTGTAGANCQTATNRRATTSAAVCAHRTAWSGGQITTTMPTLEFRPQELFPDGCNGTAQGTYVFYVLAVSAPGDTTTDVTANHHFAFNVALDFEAPEAPTVEDAAGDRQIAVEWTNAATETLAGARVYVDTSAACGASTLLVEGSAAPSSLTPAATVTGSAPTTADIDGADLGLAVGESAPMAVTVLDTARNESVLSNVACLERVPVEGFWDGYCREHMLSTDECRQRYSGCTAMPGLPSQRQLALLALAALGLVVARRRVGRGGAR